MPPPSSGTVLWGTSFDAIPVSGVVVEFLKVARIFHGRGYKVHLDLGYDIKEDKDNFFKPYGEEARLFPDWVSLDRVDGVERVAGYDRGLVQTLLNSIASGRGAPPAARLDAVRHSIRRCILRKWHRLGVAYVLVENGTLPENIVYTQALYDAIEEYGRATNLGRYVLWRDHDLMWSSESGSGRYGQFPYPHAVRPTNSPFVQYLALHDEARAHTLEWVPGLKNIETLHNAFRCDAPATGGSEGNGSSFRAHFGIPPEALLIARYTRIIPQKRIDRDIDLMARVSDRLRRLGVSAPVYLFVAGDLTECRDEVEALRRQARVCGVADRVVFGGRLAPCESDLAGGSGFSVRDLLVDADIASFLSSYDYESYGNPIGEAIAHRVPYVSTRYQLYDAVYGERGFRAPMLEISPGHDGLATESFVGEVADLLADPAARRDIADRNYARGREHFEPGQAERLIDRLVPLPPMRASTRIAVVVPVYNEAENIDAVLRSIACQCDQAGRSIRELYEIILVDNNSSDDTVRRARAFAAAHPDLAIHVITEARQGVACARRAGMGFAARRSHGRDRRVGRVTPFYLVSADADCRVDRCWLSELVAAMDSTGAAIGVCDYFYEEAHFAGRPRLWQAITRTLRCRAVTFALFGGFPDGKGFAVDRGRYERVGGIEIFYQLREGRFVNHLSDDWDFGIKMRASGEDIVYVPTSSVEINPRRVDHAIDEVITGRAYGSDGIIVMRDIRPDAGQPTAPDSGPGARADLTEAQAAEAWAYSIKDFVPKNMILPVLLTPALLDQREVIDFFSPSLAHRLRRRIGEMVDEMGVRDFRPIHSYKTPCYRLYFEFADELFGRLRSRVGEDIGHPPPFPSCLDEVRHTEALRDFVYYYCEDRESGEAHNYFGNGGVF